MSDHGDVVEADLQRWYQIDLRDRWRRDDRGVPLLTLRRIAVLLSQLPAESALASVGRDGELHWSLEAHLLDDLRMVWTGSKEKPARPHPLRPGARQRSGWADPRRVPKLEAALRRARARRAQIHG